MDLQCPGLLAALLADGSGRPGRPRQRYQPEAGLGIPPARGAGGPARRLAAALPDYLFLAYNTATSFSPADVAPLTHRAKMLMMAESMISLLATVIVLSRAIKAMPS